MPRKISIQEEEEIAEATGEKKIIVKTPKSFDVYELELNNDLAFVRGWASVAGKQHDNTRVYKRVR